MNLLSLPDCFIRSLEHQESTWEDWQELIVLSWQADIAKAYRSLALRYHPDKNRDKVKDAEASCIFSEWIGIICVCLH